MRLALYCIKHVSRYARNVLYDCAMLLGSTSTQDQARLRSLGLRRRSWSTTPGSRSCCTRAARRPATRTSLWRARRRSFLKLWRRTEWFDFFCLSDSVFFFLSVSDSVNWLFGCPDSDPGSLFQSPCVSPFVFCLVGVPVSPPR
jgi:hypothetical protein